MNINATKNEQKYTYFFHLTSPFSNFHPSKFEYKDYTFISNEQFMMFSKAKQFNDDSIADKIINIEKSFDIRDENGNFKTKENEDYYNLIMNFKEGRIDRTQIVNDKELSEKWNKIMITIKKLGRDVKNYDDAVWSEKRAKVVLFGARLKFTQNEDLKQILLNTGDTLMCEASKFDKVWGCGLSEYDAKRTPPEKWPGLNLLGQVLDYLKNELRNNLVKKPKL